jgi:hypothetical protein
MARKKARKNKRTLTAEGKAVQEALQVTWVLKGHLKNVQIAYIRVGALLTQVRDQELFAKLKHPDLEDYAEKRLQLGRSSLYKYLQVYEWVAKFHPEWLKPKSKGSIPDLSDVADLIWIEKELATKGLSPERRTALEDLQKKALEGKLRDGDLAKLRRRGKKGEDVLKAFLSKLRNLRMRGSQLASMPSEVIVHLDAAIEILRNEHAVARCDLDFFRSGQQPAMA